MNPQTENGALPMKPEEFELHLVCGSGGSKAITGSAGAILACYFAGIRRYGKIGGASGGSILTALLAGGMHPVKILHAAIEISFIDKITRHATIWQAIATYFLKDNFYLLVRPRKGLYSSYKLGKYIDEHVPAWPASYWTVAAAGSSQILFTRDGVFEYRLDGTRRCLSRIPPPVGLAVRATAAIPGVFDAIKYRGRQLHDGALSIDGRTPIGPLTRHHGVVPERIIAVDVGEDSTERPIVMFFFWRVFWRIICGRHCPIEGKTPVNSAGTILIKPNITEFESLDFDLNHDEKWGAIMAGFIAGCHSLKEAGILKGEKSEEAQVIMSEYLEIQRTSSQPGERAIRTEALLAAHGLY